jgi:cytochrome c biogenesis protein CcmG, thiol:disulfide interchange protein DsbE
MPDQESPAVAETSQPEIAAPRRRYAPIIALVVAAVLGGLFWVLASSDSGPTDKAGVIGSPQVGRPAPSVRGTTLDGVPFDLSRRKGSWVVLNFFWSGCVPCKAEHPQLVEFVAQQATFADGAEFYTIAQDFDKAADIRDFFAKRGGDWPVLSDENGSIFVSFGVAKVPETFIIDPNGIVRLRWAGEIDAITLSQLVQQQRRAFEAAP